MIRDNTHGHVCLCVVAVLYACDRANIVKDTAHRIHLKEVVNALHDAGEALKPHSGVDILLRKLGVVSGAVVVELREYVVPEFHVAVAVASRLAVRRMASEFLSAVKVYLGAGTAGT